MRRLVILSALLLAAPATAATYQATPAAAPTEAKLIVKSIAWNRDGATYRGATEESRPAVICQGLAKQAGALTRFNVDGTDFTAAQLDRCNASAGATTALAQAK